MDICQLSQEETGRLEHYGIWPTCSAHPHTSETQALEAVKAETHRFVGGPDTKVDFVTAIVATNVTRMWEPTACHDPNGKPLQGFRTWGMKPLK